MIIDCISDLHGYYPQLEGGDLLIVAGDLTARDTFEEYFTFSRWAMDLDYHKIIVIAGNHDNGLIDDNVASVIFSGNHIVYLCDSEIKLFGLKIWGSPWTLKFDGMNSQCMAFTCDTEEELAEKWALIPHDTDILITHSPPYGFRDKNIHGKHCGSGSLKAHIWTFWEPLKIHVFGHIHEGYGIALDKCYELSDDECYQQFINASHVNERYQPVNKPVRVIL